MILVSGTKRSGTSMWMQILAAAGVSVIGEPFPRDWARTIREANRAGFFESPLRAGIYHATNPHPRTQRYYAPEETRDTAVKVFVPGLLRTDLAFIDRVLGAVRSLREYAPSLERLYAMEVQNKAQNARAAGRTPLPPIAHMPAGLEWWNDNVRLLRDAELRRYPLKLASYAAVLARPALAAELVAWLGVGDPGAAVRAVQPALRTQVEGTLDLERIGLPPEALTLADELYARVHGGLAIEGRLRAHLDAMHEQLAPAIGEAEQRLKESRKRVRALRLARRKERAAG